MCRTAPAEIALRRGQLPTIVALVILCTACQHIPPAPLEAATNADHLAKRSLAAPGVAKTLARHELSLASDSWSLDQLTLAAWTLRTDLAVARAEVAAARTATGIERERPNPSVSTTTEKVVDAGVARPWVIGAALALTLEPGGKRAIRRERALANEEVLQWRFGEALWLARTEVRAALLEVAYTRELLALDNEETRLAQAFLTWVETRLALGAATTLERLVAVQAVNASSSRRDLNEAADAKASATLAAAVGVAPDELVATQLLLPQLATLREVGNTDNVNAARDLALVNRLDVRRALAEYAVAEQELRAAVASQYPDLTLAPGYTVDQADHKIALGLGLPVPLFHNANAAIERAIAARALAAAKFDDVQSAALAAIDIAVAQHRASRNALAAAEQAESNATDLVASLERRLAAGAANRGEVLAGQIALAGLKRNTLAARRAMLDALTALEGGIEHPLFPPSTLEAASAIGELLAGPTP